MDKQYKKAISLFEFWMILNHPEYELGPLFEEFEKDFPDFKEFIDGFYVYASKQLGLEETIKN